MPVEVIDTANGLGVIVVGSGTVTADELLRGDELAYQPEAKLSKLKYMLNDYRAATFTNVTEEDLLKSIKNDTEAAKINPDIAVAVVAEEDLIFGMSRVWETLVDVHEVQFKTFTTRSLKEAKAWIKEETGIEVDYAG